MRTQLNFNEAAPDSVLSFEVLGHIYIRGREDSYTVTEDNAVSVWSPLPGITVHTEILPHKDGHRRIHTIESEYECKAYDAGFALPVSNPTGCTVRSLQGGGTVRMLKPDPNTSLIYSKTVIPVAEYQIVKGTNRIETDVLYD
jgi:hypothetical protein